MEIILILIFVFIIIPALALYALISLAGRAFGKAVVRIKVD